MESFQEDVDDVIPLPIRTLKKNKGSAEHPKRDSCNWVAALTDKEIRDTQRQDIDTWPLRKWKTEDYTLTELDMSLCSKALKHVWNCLLHRYMYY